MVPSTADHVNSFKRKEIVLRLSIGTPAAKTCWHVHRYNVVCNTFRGPRDRESWFTFRVRRETSVPVETKPPESRFKISGWIDSGITFNADSPQDNQNFGRFFDDRANEPLLNQAVINFERALAPQPGAFDWGFKLQLMYGSDARFIHSLGLFSDTAGTSIVQPDLPEAYLNLHFPIISGGGLDLKLGKFVTLEGVETIDPRTNFF